MTNRTDNFDRADSVLTINSPSDGGADWTIPTATAVWGISTNRGYSVTGVSQDIVVLESSVNNIDVQATIAIVGSDPGLVARVADDNNYVLLIISSTALKIWKRVSGSFTLLFSSGTLAIANGDVIKFEADSSNNLTAFQNGASKVTGVESAGSTNTKHGLRANSDTTSRFDNFSITALGGAATPYQPELLTLGVT